MALNIEVGEASVSVVADASKFEQQATDQVSRAASKISGAAEKVGRSASDALGSGITSASSGGWVSRLTSTVVNSGKNAALGFANAVADVVRGPATAVVGGASAALGTALVSGFQRLNAIDVAKNKLRGLGHDTQAVEAIMKNALASVKGTAFGLGEAATVAAGAVAAGKTRFLRMSVVQVGDGLTGRGSLRALSTEAKAFLKDSHELVQAERHTVKTPHVMPRALQYHVVERGGKEIELNIIDAAGEFFGDWETSNELPFLEAAPAYVLLLDPLGLKDVHAEFTQTLPTDQDDMDIAPPDQINAYHTVMDRLRAQGVDLSRRALLVVVSKADILRSLPCGETLRGSASSDAVRQWLADNGMDAALQSFRMDFGTVEYFACDSMHHLPHEDPVSPWRVVSRVAALNDAAALQAEPAEPAGQPATADATA